MRRIWQLIRAWRELEGDFRPCSTPWWEDKLDSCSDERVPVGVRNTYSNLAYAAAGIALYLTERTPESVVMAAALVLLCLGSMAYHAVPGRLTNALDHGGMYGSFLGLATYAAGGTWIPMLAALFLGTLTFRFAHRAPLNAMMGLFCWVAGVAAWASGSRPLLYASAASFALAMAAWTCDKRRLWTGRWGHAVWHVGTATGLGLLFAAVGR